MTTAVNARITGQLQQGHAAMNAAGLGSPALDDFNNVLTLTTPRLPRTDSRISDSPRNSRSAPMLDLRTHLTEPTE